MFNLIRLQISFLVVLVCASTAGATSVSIDLSAFANGSWCNVGGGPMVNCTALPSGSQVFNGQNFDIAGANGGNNAWFSSAAANNGPGSVSLTIPVNVANVVSAYTLMNTFWGQSGATPYDSVTFTGSLGNVYRHSRRQRRHP